MTFPSVSSLSGSNNIIHYFILSRIECSDTTLKNEMLNNIVTVTERGDREECHNIFPSLTFQSPEEGGNKPPNRGL